MKTSQFKNYNELPLFLNAEIISKVLGISPASSYELMHESGFPVLRIGNRMVVSKEKFIHWVEKNTAGVLLHEETSSTYWLAYAELKTVPFLHAQRNMGSKAPAN